MGGFCVGKLAPGGVRGESSRNARMQRVQKKKLHEHKKQKNNARTHRDEKILQLLQNAYDA